MAVIALPSIQPQGSAVTDDWELRSITAMNRSPLNGVATTLERPGAHWAVTPRFHNLNGSNRARMQQHLANCRGHGSRMYVPLYGWTRRGSFAAPELLPSLSSTTGWSANANAGSVPTLSSSDGILRGTLNGYASDPYFYVTVSGTPYAPYCLRGLSLVGRGTTARTFGTYLSDAISTESLGAAGMRQTVLTAASGSMFAIPAYPSSVTSGLAGDYWECGHASLARCALVDNGPNHVLQSQTLQTTWTQTGLSALGVNTAVAPDGTTTMDVLQENSANSGHSIDQSGARTNQADDICSFGYFKRTAGTRNVRLAAGNDLADFGSAVFDLGAGTVGSVTNAGTATNTRAFVAPVGGGAYFCCVVARCTAAATLRCIVNMANGTTVVYTGDGASQIGGWGVGCTVSSVPTRGGVTVASALQSGTLQTGSALYLKGLPASTNGLLLQGDPVEIITNTSSQLVRVRSSLNSDAAGLGYLQFEAPLRISPLDNAAVIVCNPLCRMMLDDNTVRWSEHDGTFTDLEFTSVEDTYP